MAGRTHGIHAEPITFGSKLALWALQLRRDRVRLERAREAVAVGKVSGAVGSYSNVDPQVEAYVCEQLGLRPAPSTQVIARDRHAELLYACAALGSSIESFALEVRHLQRTEVGEVQEPFAAGAQKGSSAMPHKRNPWRSEQLCGLARVLRGNLQAGLENVALWHERDMSHSSVERIVLTDSLILAYYMTGRFRDIVDGPHRAHRTGCARTSTASYGLVFSEAVLLASGRGGPRARRRVPLGPAGRDAHVGGSGVRSATCSPRIRRSPRTCRRRGSTSASTSTVRSRTRRAPSTRSRRPTAVSHVALPHHYTGKVRELYEVGHDRMLVVASDRISVFDVVLGDTIPDKGRVLTGAVDVLVRRDRVDRARTTSCRPTPPTSRRPPGSDVAGRAMLVRAARPVRLECVARGYLFGSAWKDYQETGSVQGRATPGRPRAGRAAAVADLHAHHEGRGGPRPAALRRRGRRARGRRALRAAPRPHAARLRVRCRARGCRAG